MHVAPGSVICGGVCIGEATFIGSSFTVLPLIKIGKKCMIAVGATVAKDLNDGDQFLPHRNSFV